METRRPAEQRRGFLETKAGYLNVVQFVPEGTPTAAVLFVPPFGEEMNHCRIVMAEAGRRLAKRGFETSVVDLTGTGESSGNLVDVDLPRWVDDMRVMCDALTAESYPVAAVVGIRFGALLAAVALRRLSLDIPLIMWQPVVNGADHLREMAAQRAIADRLRGDARAPSTADVMEWLRTGRDVELGGYHIGASLGKAMFKLELPQRSCARDKLPHWIEIVRTSDPSPRPGLPGSSSTQTAWAARVTRVDGPPFWTLPGCPLPTQLFDATENILFT